jgi:CRP-like cAMP-binding protein
MMYGTVRYGAVPAAGHPAQVKSNRFLAALAPADFSLLSPYLRNVWLERGAVLHEPGDEIEHVYFPHSGMVSLVVVMQNGASVETATMGRAGAIGITAALGSRRAVGRAIVQLPGEAARLSADRFKAAANDSKPIRDLLARYNDALLMQVQQSVACNALHMLEARLARWLLQSHDCLDGQPIPLTQDLLAQMLGVRRTTVTLTARLLQDAGMIRYSRGLVHIVDRAQLEQTACECYATVRSHLDDVFGASPSHSHDTSAA